MEEMRQGDTNPNGLLLKTPTHFSVGRKRPGGVIPLLPTSPRRPIKIRALLTDDGVSQSACSRPHPIRCLGRFSLPMVNEERSVSSCPRFFKSGVGFSQSELGRPG